MKYRLFLSCFIDITAGWRGPTPIWRFYEYRCIQIYSEKKGGIFR